MNSAILSLALAAILAPAVEKSSTATTRVYVQTDPSGAVVKLDGKPVGKSDDLFVVPPGVRKMTVEVELDDHYPARQEVEVRGGRITRVKLNLDRRKGAEGEKPTTVVPKEADNREVAAIVEKTVKTVSTMAEGDPNMAKVLASLKGLDEADAVKEVAKFLDSKMETIRRAAIYILWRGAFRSIEPAVPALLRLCEHEEDMTRGMAAIALGGNHVAGSFPRLIKMTTEDPSGYARRCAAYALGLLGDKEAVPTLRKALKDADPLVRNNAQAALTMLDAHQEGSKQKPAQPPAGDSSDKQPAPARLDFRIAPVRDGKPELSEAEIKRYADDLKAHGPEAGRKADQPYAWFETRVTNPQVLTTAQYQDRTYALLSNKPDDVMLARGDRRGAWGLKRVAAEKDEKGHPAILVELDGAGGGRLRELSKANIHRQLAILVNDVVIFAPELQSTISDKAQIAGRFTEEEVQELVAALRAGMSSRESKTRASERATPRTATGAGQPQLRMEPGQPLTLELLDKIRDANSLWLKPAAQSLAYSFSMEHPGRNDRWEAKVEYHAPDRAVVRADNRPSFEGRVDDGYDPDNSAHPPRRITLLQATTFFGPLQASVFRPGSCIVWVVGEETRDGSETHVVQIKPVPKSREAPMERSDHESILPMRVGCGIWGTWYGYSGGGADVDQVWVEKATGRVLREEGFFEKDPRFVVEYGDFEKVADGRHVPRHVVVTLLGKGDVFPWVFDMEFVLVQGRIWLLKTLHESQGERKNVAVANVSDAKGVAEGPMRAARIIEEFEENNPKPQFPAKR